MRVVEVDEGESEKQVKKEVKRKRGERGAAEGVEKLAREMWGGERSVVNVALGA